MATEPNISKEALQALDFVGRQGDHMVYQGKSNGDKKLVMVDVKTVKRLGIPIRSRKKQPKQLRHSEEDDVWSGSRSCQPRDKMATARLLEILKSYHLQGDMSTSKRMRKKEMWVEIASQLMEEGFNFRSEETAWEKVSQKWRNLERSYRVCVENMRKVNKGFPPPGRGLEFFEDLHFLLSAKYNTGDILTVDREEQDEDETSQLNGDMEEDANDDMITVEPGPGLFLEDQEEGFEEQDEQPEVNGQDVYEDYAEEEQEASSVVDDKSLVFAGGDPHTAGVRNPVIRLLLEMRSQERQHHRDDRRERLQMQRELLEFKRDLVDMLDRQHRERMDAMYALIAAIGGQQPSNGRTKRPSRSAAVDDV